MPMPVENASCGDAYLFEECVAMFIVLSTSSYFAKNLTTYTLQQQQHSHWHETEQWTQLTPQIES